MQKVIIAGSLFCFLLVSHVTFAQEKGKQPERLENNIRQYWFVFLGKGTNRSQDSVEVAKLQKAHLDNINRLYYEGKIKVAGPFGDDGKWVGVFIFDCATKEEVEQLLQTDPAVHAGRLMYEIHPWYTAAVGSFVPGKPKASTN